MVIGRVQIWNDRQESHEVSIGASHSQDRSILGPVDAGNFTARLHDLNLVSDYLLPVVE